MGVRAVGVRAGCLAVGFPGLSSPPDGPAGCPADVSFPGPPPDGLPSVSTATALHPAVRTSTATAPADIAPLPITPPRS